MRKTLQLLLLILLLAVGFGYWEVRGFIHFPLVTVQGSFSQPVSIPVPQPMAGIAVRDITPPLHLPRFGYSTLGSSSQQIGTRLKARAFYLKNSDGIAVGLIQADLGTGSLLLHHRIAERVAAQTDIPAHAISVLVTHTHSAPGNYLESNFYNMFGSNQPGFDPGMADFLTAQLSDALIAAWQQQTPARFATGQQEVWHATRNRSLPAWARNFEIPPPALTEAMALQAVNPRLTMLRIDLQHPADGHFYPAAALSSYSVHGTALPANYPGWHADVWHAFSQTLEQHIQTLNTPFTPQHGVFQATHGDNNPVARGPQGAEAIGQQLAAASIQLFDALGEKLEARLPLQAHSRLLALQPTNGRAFPLCERPVVGAATLGAANGDEVFPLSYLPYFKEGWRRVVFNENCQGVKPWALSQLQRLLPAKHFPDQALLQLFQLQDWWLFTLPWEVTLESGNRIRNSLRQALQLAPEALIEISSLANGYLGYAVTPEEYQAQFYEGGHTLYGPHTVPFLQQQAVQLALDSQQATVRDLPSHFSFQLHARQQFPDDSSQLLAAQRPKAGQLILSGQALHTLNPARVRWQFWDANNQLLLDDNHPAFGLQYLSRSSQWQLSWPEQVTPHTLRVLRPEQPPQIFTLQE